jgi:PLP dependent protein
MDQRYSTQTVNKQELITHNIHHLQEKVSHLSKKYRPGLSPAQLMAVSKKASVQDILFAHQAGIDLFGENYIQSALTKLPLLFQEHHLSKNLFHFIGHLQSNKINKAMELFSSLDAIDSTELAQSISKKSASLKEGTSIYIEVNTSMETTKFGFNPDNLLLFMDKIVFLENIKVCGLMTMGPLNGNEKDNRSSFSLLRNMKEELEKRYSLAPLKLSMGMSDDYEWAIQEGSDMIRIGRGIFGEESVVNE